VLESAYSPRGGTISATGCFCISICRAVLQVGIAPLPMPRSSSVTFLHVGLN